MTITLSDRGLVLACVKIFLYAVCTVAFVAALLLPPQASAITPTAPANFSVQTGYDFVILSWDASSVADQAVITGYEYTKNNGTDWLAVPGSDGTTTSYTVEDLTTGQEYTFGLRAAYTSTDQVSISSVVESSTSFTITLLGLWVDVGYDRIRLNWTQPPLSENIVRYEYKVDSGLWQGISGSGPSTTSHVIENVPLAQQRTYRVRAVTSLLTYESNPTTAVGNKITHTIGPAFLSRNDYFGSSVARTLDGTGLFIGEPGDGEVHLFSNSDGIWEYTEKITPPGNTHRSSDFGVSVAVSDDGNTLVVGANEDDTGGNRKGAVHLFTKQNNAWVHAQKLDDTDSDFTLGVNFGFGSSVATSSDGTTVFVGAPGGGSGRKGVVYVFLKGVSDWEYSSLLSDSLSGVVLSNNDAFGSSLASSRDGQTLFVGVPGKSAQGNDRGALFIFTKEVSGWSYSSEIDGSTTGVTLLNNDEFGSAAAISSDGRVLAVGAPGDNASGSNRGAVYVFFGSGTSWSFIRKITHVYDGVSLSNGDGFGSSLALSHAGNTIFFWRSF